MKYEFSLYERNPRSGEFDKTAVVRRDCGSAEECEKFARTMFIDLRKISIVYSRELVRPWVDAGSREFLYIPDLYASNPKVGKDSED